MIFAFFTHEGSPNERCRGWQEHWKDFDLILSIPARKEEALPFFPVWVLTLAKPFFASFYPPLAVVNLLGVALTCWSLSFYNRKLLYRKSMMQTLPVPITSNLGQVYADISEELFNKHAKLLSQLKNRFADLYDDFQPEKYVIVNGVAKVIELGRGLRVQFALENGVTVLFRKTYPTEDIFINGNHLDQEIIFNAQGKHTEGIHQKVDELHALLTSIRKRAGPKEFFGGIFYVHSNIGEELFAAHESFMLALFIALLHLHDELENYTRPEIIAALIKADPSLSTDCLIAMLGEFEVGKCNVEVTAREEVESDNELQLTLCDPISDKSIKTHESNESIRIGEQKSFKSSATRETRTLKHCQSGSTESNDSIPSLAEDCPQPINTTKMQLDPSRKLILCKLDLSKEEQQFYQSRMAAARTQREGEGGDDRELQHYIQEMETAVQALLSGRVDFSEFIAQKQDLQVKYELFDEEVVALLTQIRQEAPFLKNFCLLEGCVLLIAADKQYYPEIIRFLRRLFNDYKLSTCRFLQTHRRISEEKECEIGEIMFTTSPSLGCAIYDPAENCWL